MDYPLAITIVCSLWLISELLINYLTRSKRSVAKSHDRNSFSLFGIVILISIGLGLYIIFEFPRFSAVKFFSGITLMIIGISIRLFTFFSIKSHYNANVAVHQNYKLKTDGIFKIVRHPSYSGSLLTFFGLGLMLGNWISLIAIFIPVLCVVLYRIKIEEKALLNHFKKEYRDYQKQTKRLIPLIY